MISPLEIKNKALKQYPNFLTAVLQRSHFFPLYIKGNKGKANLPIEELFPALKRLLEGAKNKKGYGYTVTLKTVQTRHAGEMTMPDEIFFENVEDFVKFIDKEQEFLAFRKVAMQSQKALPTLIPWMQDNPLKVLKHLTIWDQILKVAQYFLSYPLPQIYARAIPLDIPPTFIENNKPILSDVLEAILPKTAIQQEAQPFEKRFGLRYEEPLIRLRSLDTKILINESVEDLSLPLGECKKLLPKVATVFICTDLLNYLRFPTLLNGLIIYGDKHTLENLGELEWLKEKKIFFWGDINENGFQQLSNLRQYLPKTAPFLMDSTTFEAFKDVAEIYTDNIKPTLPFLNAAEQNFVLFLNGLKEKNTLLQQHISQVFLKKKLGAILDL